MKGKSAKSWFCWLARLFAFLLIFPVLAGHGQNSSASVDPLAIESDFKDATRAAGAASINKNIVTLRRKSLCDANGPFLGLGASYFQALRDTKFDRARLSNNLGVLASNGFNFIRVLGMVSWDGLETAPVTFTNRSGHLVNAWPDYWEQFGNLLEIAGAHNLRV